MTTYTDSRLINIDSDNADIYNNSNLRSDMVYFFKGLLTEDDDSLYSQISIQSAQFPVSFYVVNYSNNTLRYQYHNSPITTISFDVGNYNATSFIAQFHSQVVNQVSLTFDKLTGKYLINSNQNFTFYQQGSTCFRLLGLDLESDLVGIAPYDQFAPFPCNFAGITRLKIVSEKLATYSRDSSTITNVLATIPVNAPPFGILLYQNTSNFKAMLRERVIDFFDIRIYDDFNNLINFNGIEFGITLQIDIIRNYSNMDTTFPPLQRTIAPATKPLPEEPEPVPDGIPDDNLPLGTGDTDLDFFLYSKGIYGW
jgi:hypothetical protein